MEGGGRNGPCPCGSGKKHKKCCALKKKGLSERAITVETTGSKVSSLFVKQAALDRRAQLNSSPVDPD